MFQTPLKTYEAEYESFIRLWMFYFFNVKEYMLICDILMSQKKSMLQFDIIRKDHIDYSSSMESNELINIQDREFKVSILKDLYDCYILDKREIMEPDFKGNEVETTKKEGRSKKPKKEVTCMKEDKRTIWGFGLDNIAIFKEYLAIMKESTENEKKKKAEELNKIDVLHIPDSEAEYKRSQKVKEIAREISDLERFLNKSLVIVEDKLNSLIELSEKINVNKSLYLPSNYNATLMQDKDNSRTFQVYGQPFKQHNYVKLHTFCSENKDFPLETDHHHHHHRHHYGHHQHQDHHQNQQPSNQPCNQYPNR